MTSNKQPKKEPMETTAVHYTDGDCHHLVGFGNLRVVIVPDGANWFAQCLEIDYCAQGSSIEDVKTQFADGLMATIHEHLKVYGNIEGVLEPAPKEVWRDLVYCKSAKAKRFSQTTAHTIEDMPAAMQGILPFEGINYLEQTVAA